MLLWVLMDGVSDGEDVALRPFGPGRLTDDESIRLLHANLRKEMVVGKLKPSL